MKSVQSYRDLIVWQKSMDLTEHTYQHTRDYPKEETYGMVSQMRRAAVSIPANIAEGQSRRATGEFLNALSVSRGSLSELETLFILSERLNYVSSSVSQQLLDECTEISKMLNGLMKSLAA